MTPRERAEACMAELHPLATSEERDTHYRWLAAHAPAMARDVLAALGREEALRKALAYVVGYANAAGHLGGLSREECAELAKNCDAALDAATEVE